jgi:hypothetical protein
MHVTVRAGHASGRATRWVAAAALLGGLGLAAGSGAQADTAGTNGQVIFTNIVLTGSHTPPGETNPPIGWTPPKCWLEPNSGFGVTDAYTPDGFALYMAQINALYHHTGETDLQYETNRIYHEGLDADAVVGITNPPYNLGLSGGMWYMISCSSDAVYADYEAFKSALGVTNDYEEWFWLNNGTSPPGVKVANPELLAEYAAANTTVTPGWPTMSPSRGTTQTVNLPTLVTNTAGTNGFRKYSATATLTTTNQSSTVTAVPVSITFYSTGMSPSTVVCSFNANGSLKSGCDLNWYKSSAAGYKLTASTIWSVSWNGHAGAAGWPKQIGPFTQTYAPVVVQEIQTIVGQ